MDKNKITIEVLVTADPYKTWDYYNSPKHITKWNAASPEWHCPTAENDLKTGGKLKSRMEAKDGSFGFDFEGTYTDVQDQKTLTYVLGDGRMVTTSFEAVGSQTKVTTVFDPDNQHPADFQKAGWQSILDNFKNYTESH